MDSTNAPLLEKLGLDENLNIKKQFTVKTTFCDEYDNICHTIGGVEYYYRAYELIKHPDFIVTKALMSYEKHVKAGKSGGYEEKNMIYIYPKNGVLHIRIMFLEPEVYPFIYRYVRYGIYTTFENMRDRLGCSYEDVKKVLLPEYGIRPVPYRN